MIFQLDVTKCQKEIEQGSRQHEALSLLLDTPIDVVYQSHLFN
jgi:hypothetical protein